MQTREMTSQHYLVATCSLHNIQTAFCNAVQEVLGEGGHDDNRGFNMNVMQLLHGAYNIQNWR